MVVGRIQLLLLYWDRVPRFLADCWLKVALSVLDTCHSMKQLLTWPFTSLGEPQRQAREKVDVHSFITQSWKEHSIPFATFHLL